MFALSMPIRAARVALVVLVVALGLVAAVGLPGHASAMAVVLHPSDNPDCSFEPGDVPGVDVFFPAQCTLVFTPGGTFEVIGHGHLPAGYSLSKTFVGTLPCF